MLHINTPLVLSEKLKQSIEKNIYFKLDTLQPTQSFKIRGVGQLCQHYKSLGYLNFIASSGGNGGVAVAYAGMKLNIPTTVFIPKTSNKIYIDRIKLYKAEVIIAGDNWDEAHAQALAFSKQNETTVAYIPPFDHPLIWDGHASIIDECANMINTPDAIIVSVGGGGLACGVLEGMYRNNWNKTALITTETYGADCFYQAVQVNQIITLNEITSLATSLGAKTVCKKLFEWSQVHDIQALRVSDDDAAKACQNFAQEHGMMTELASGAAMSVVYNNLSCIESYRNILVIVCGGINTEFLLCK